MVKNSGGNKGKKVARKTSNNSTSITNDVRRIKDEGEKYAVITKVYSSKRCVVTDSDGIVRQCNIRGKFLMRRRGSVQLNPGLWVMIGFYDWEVRGDGKQSCDLLEIYSQSEKDKLKQLEGHNLKHIMNIGELEGTENEFTFSNFHINENENDDTSSSSEEDDALKPAVIVEPVVIKKKENITEQMDWLTINERDI